MHMCVSITNGALAHSMASTVVPTSVASSSVPCGSTPMNSSSTNEEVKESKSSGPIAVESYLFDVRVNQPLPPVDPKSLNVRKKIQPPFQLPTITVASSMTPMPTTTSIPTANNTPNAATNDNTDTQTDNSTPTIGVSSIELPTTIQIVDTSPFKRIPGNLLYASITPMSMSMNWMMMMVMMMMGEIKVYVGKRYW
jgi:hypothetical protein